MACLPNTQSHRCVAERGEGGQIVHFLGNGPCWQKGLWVYQDVTLGRRTVCQSDPKKKLVCECSIQPNTSAD